jgi:hypothetical protein
MTTVSLKTDEITFPIASGNKGTIDQKASCRTPTMIHDKKRKLDEVLTSNDTNRNNNKDASINISCEQQQQQQRQRYVTELQMQFLNVHYRLLQSLYQSCPMVDDHDNSKSKNDDSQTSYTAMLIDSDDSIWDRIQDFMEQREYIFRYQEKVIHMSSINQEAKKYTQAIATTTPMNDHYHHQSLMQTSSPAMMNDLRNTPSGLVLSPPPVASSATLSNHHHRHSTTNAFSVIANIIQQRSNLYQSSVQLPISTTMCHFRQLIRDVQNHMQSLRMTQHQFQQSTRQSNINYLHSLVQTKNRITDSSTCNDDAGSHNKVQSSSRNQLNERSYIAELEHKLQLWSLLANDLNVIIGSNDK